jgi:alpha/beta superfamily hydrolase
VDLDINQAADEAKAIAVLLHPHPDYGGNLWHPFVDELYRRLPAIGATAVRFDFSTSAVAAARGEVVTAIDQSSSGELEPAVLPVLLVGYSFGAGVAAGVDDERIAGWYLLAPPAVMLAGAVIGDDPRPKRIVQPEWDQFSPPEVVASEVADWRATSVGIALGADHFLAGHVAAVVAGAVEWVAGQLES